jgi:dCTP deaminase
MILSDRDIKELLDKGRLKIDPIFKDTVRENGIDLRIGKTIARLRYTNVPFDMESSNIEEFYVKEVGDAFVINPNEHVLLTTEEYIELPDDVVGLVNLRSTFARAGLVIPPTVVDAGFKGQLTIELIGSNFPVVLKPGMRFLHLVLVKTLNPVEKPYNGKYQGQVGVVPPRLDVRA